MTTLINLNQKYKKKRDCKDRDNGLRKHLIKQIKELYLNQ